MRESFFDYGECPFGQAVLRKSTAWRPLRLADVIGRAKSAGDGTTDVVDQDVMILGDTLGVPDNSLEDLQYVFRLYFEASLFAYLPANALYQGFSDFEHSARQRPVPLKGRFGPLDQQNPVTIEDDGAHSKDRAFGITAIVANTALIL
jgi:hypothetical protein